MRNWRKEDFRKQTGPDDVYTGFGKRTDGQRERERDRGSEREGTDRQRDRSPSFPILPRKLPDEERSDFPHQVGAVTCLRGSDSRP